MQTLGERIKFVQKRSGKIQTGFAESLGVSKGSLILYQKNERAPDSSFLQTLCRKYHVNPAWLLMGEGEPFISVGGAARTPEARKPVNCADSALYLVEEAIQETGASINEIQKQHLVGIIREEMKILAGQVARALKRGTIREYNP